MKAKHVFTTLGLALVMGLGVGAALATPREAVQTKAATATTVYLAVDTEYTVKLNVNRKGDGDDWETYTMTKTGDKHETKDVYYASFTDLYDGLGCIQFQLYDGETWKEEDQVFGKYSWTSPSVYNNKLHVYKGSGWVDFTPSGITTYSVDVYVDGVKRGTETINEGSLPAEPTLTVYGKGFSGWYSNSDLTGPKVTEITSDTTVYGEIYTLPQWSYIVDASRVSTTFANKFLYAFESNNRHNADWPGAEMNDNTVIVPNDAGIIISNGGTAQTEDVTQSHVPNDTLRILNDYTEHDGKRYYSTVWTSTLDEPSEEGYYLVSSKGDWKYDNATKMTFNNDYSPLDAQGNVAILLNVALEANEEIKVRSFINDVDEWYSVGTSDQTWGKESGGNWKTLVAGNYDIFYKDATFYISQAAERYTIGVVDRLYRGSTLISYENGVSQMATAGVNFEPIEPTRSGYSFIGFYTDLSCTTEYVEKQFTGDDTLYAKFEMNAAVDGNNGIYMVGDATFTGNADYAWNVQGATYIYNATNDTANNLYEGTIVIPNSASELTPVSVRLAFYNNGVLNYGDAEAELGMSYSFVGMDSNNYAFNKGGTYAVYVTKTWKIYFNMGADAFYTKFLTDVGAACQADGSTNVVALQAVWAEMESAYNSLSAEDQATIKAVGFNGGSDADDLHRVVAKYHYIVAKYGTEAFNDFIWEQTISPASNTIRLFANTNNNTVLLVVVISSVAIVASLGITFYFLRKRKYSK